jgi:hypothetical protein
MTPKKSRRARIAHESGLWQQMKLWAERVSHQPVPKCLVWSCGAVLHRSSKRE